MSSNQGNQVGQDSSKFGLKFDADKSRIDLVHMKSFKTLMDAVENMRTTSVADHVASGSINELNDYMSRAYFHFLTKVDISDGSIAETHTGALHDLSVVAGIAMRHLDIKYDVNLLKQLGDLYAYGSKLYGDNNWKMVDVDRYVSALGRHIDAMVLEKRYDDESGMKHAIHIIWNCIAIIFNMDM